MTISFDDDVRVCQSWCQWQLDRLTQGEASADLDRPANADRNVTSRPFTRGNFARPPPGDTNSTQKFVQFGMQ
jgi:hypothetical protein